MAFATCYLLSANCSPPAVCWPPIADCLPSIFLLPAPPPPPFPASCHRVADQCYHWPSVVYVRFLLFSVSRCLRGRFAFPPVPSASLCANLRQPCFPLWSSVSSVVSPPTTEIFPPRSSPRPPTPVPDETPLPA